MNPFVDLARVAEMAVVERVGEDEMAHSINTIGFAIPTHKAIFRQKVRNIHDPVGAGREHFKRLSDDRSILAVNNDRFRTRIVLIPNWSATRHDPHPNFLAKTPLCIFRKRVHEVFALPKRNLQHEFALRRGLKPKLGKLEILDDTLVNKVDELSAVHAVARKSIRMPTDNAARFLFFNPIHHGVENGTSGDFGRLFLDKLLDYKQSLASGILPKLGQLSIDRQYLFVLNISRLARIQKEFLREISNVIHRSKAAAPVDSTRIASDCPRRPLKKRFVKLSPLPLYEENSVGFKGAKYSRISKQKFLWYVWAKLARVSERSFAIARGVFKKGAGDSFLIFGSPHPFPQNSAR